MQADFQRRRRHLTISMGSDIGKDDVSVRVDVQTLAGENPFEERAVLVHLPLVQDVPIIAAHAGILLVRHPVIMEDHNTVDRRPVDVVIKTCRAVAIEG